MSEALAPGQGVAIPATDQGSSIRPDLTWWGTERGIERGIKLGMLRGQGGQRGMQGARAGAVLGIVPAVCERGDM